MPWQQYVVDVALELDPETGLPVYGEVVLTVPRQSGKTTLLLAAMVHRALLMYRPGRPQNILYAAQTRQDARKKWEDDHVKILESHKEFRKQFRVRLTNGNEAILWKNGSKHGFVANTEKAGHGETLDMGVIDEAFAHEDARLEQAFKPATSTREDAQIWILSTAGNARSTYLRSKVDTGRQNVAAGLDQDTCYFEWSAPPESDPGDPETWRACMPALGHTISEKKIAGFYQSMPLAEFRRAYLNQWPDDAPDEWLVISESAWKGLENGRSQIVGPIAIAVDVNQERSFGTIAVAGKNAAGKYHVEIAEYQPGTGWIVDIVKRMNRLNKPVAVVLDPGSPAGSLIPELEAAGITVTKISGREAAQACGQFVDAAVPAEGEPTLVHIGQVELAAAVAGAHKKQLRDVWYWYRGGYSVDISPLVASTHALWGFIAKGTKKKGSRPKVAVVYH